jgi:predicted glycosyltransferase/glycosyltransferase involved in cell wall biosynthesis
MRSQALGRRRWAVPAPRGAAAAPLRERRFIFYCNEMVGLGHLRRTLALAGGLARADEQVTSLILTGSAIEPFFELPPRTDTVKLPVRRRGSDGEPVARLAVDAEELCALRGQIAFAAAQSFKPGVAVIDKLPLGLGGELEPTLRALREDPSCRVVLGLRDIDDTPANVRRKWGPGMRDAIERYYDAILVYGPSWSPDALDAMGWGDLEVPVVHVGYVGEPMPRTGAPDLPDDYVLVTAGGGSDGFALMSTYAEAIRAQPLPCQTVMVTGPLISAEKLGALRAQVADLPVRLFVHRTDMPHVVVGARAVVSMAGYNTVSEVMRASKPALFVPRAAPSEEQLLRARLLARRCNQQLLHPADLAPNTLSAALSELLTRRGALFAPADYHGTERAVDLLGEVAGWRRRWSRAARVQRTRAPRPRVAVITSGFPRLSETFAANEIDALRRRGDLVALFATKPGEDGAPQPGAEALARDVVVLPGESPAAQGAAVAERLEGSGVTGVHGYFAHAPAEVAAHAARALDVPFGFSVHARDALKADPKELARQTRQAACVIACNPAVAGKLPAVDGVHVLPHGVDLARFGLSSPNGGRVLQLLAVGRLVEKKGFDVLLEAAAQLEIPYRLRIVGAGPRRETLQQTIEAAGLGGRVELCGPLTHAQLPAAYDAADVVVVPSVVDREGDRDGLPNVLLEAMASIRPVVASALEGFDHAVVDGETGLLFPPGDAGALADALEHLARADALRRRLGENARRRAEREFDLSRCTERFCAVVGAAYA